MKASCRPLLMRDRGFWDREMGADTKKEVAEEGNAEPGGYGSKAGLDEGQRAEDAGRAGGEGQLGNQSPGGGWAPCGGVKPDRLGMSPGPPLLRPQYSAAPPASIPSCSRGRCSEDEVRPQGLAHDRPVEAARRSRDVRLRWPGGCPHPWHLLAGSAGATAGRPFSTWKTWRLSVSLPSFEAITDSFSLERPSTLQSRTGISATGVCWSLFFI